MTTKYIGPYEVKTQEEIGENTVRVTFAEYKAADGNTYQPAMRDYTMKTLVNIISDEPCDYTDLRKKQYAPAINEIFSVLSAYDVNIGTKSGANDLEYIFREVFQRINDMRAQLEDNYWGVEEDEKTLRQLMSRWMETKDTEIRKLTLVKKASEETE